MCKQRKLNYLNLHIQSTNRKRFSPVAVDNIIRDFVFCPNAAISLYATTRSQIPTTHVSQNTVFEALNIRRSLQLLEDLVPHCLPGLCLWTPWGLPRPSCLVPPCQAEIADTVTLGIRFGLVVTRWLRST